MKVKELLDLLRQPPVGITNGDWMNMTVAVYGASTVEENPIAELVGCSVEDHPNFILLVPEGDYSVQPETTGFDIHWRLGMVR